MKKILRLVFLLCLLFFYKTLCARNPYSSSNLQDSVVSIQKINKILITGLHRTKPWIVLRELSFADGDSLQLPADAELLKNRNRIFNTRLFTTVAVTLKNDTVSIALKERWYTYPIPVLDLADRNFNEWWQVRNHDLGRVNYGLDFTQNNVRGRNETLKLYLQGGFNKKAEAKYIIPYIDKHRKLGFAAAISYIIDRQVGYRTKNNYLIFTEIAGNGRYRFSTSATLFHRNKFYQIHYLSLGLYANQIPDTIASLNPDYFLTGKTQQQFLSLQYSWVDDHRDIAYYPLKGYYLAGSISKIGLTTKEDVNMWMAYLDANWYKPLGKKWYSSFSFSQKISTPRQQPYMYARALGYNAYYVSGYELYVIDGQHFSLAKINLRNRILSFEKSFRFIPLKQFQHIPLQIYLRAYSDGGIAIDNSGIAGNAALANQFLWGNGLALDFVTYYDTVLRIEYSINKNLQSGLYLHYKSAF